MSNDFLNVGPTGEGEIPEASLERLAAMGDWMKVNGESIHGTTASLFPKVSWNGRSTTKHLPNGTVKVYLHVFEKPEGGKLVIRGLEDRPLTATTLAGSKTLAVSGGKGAWAIELPAAQDPIATVIALTFKKTPVISAPVNEPDAKGNLTLRSDDADLKGRTIRQDGDHIGWWTDEKDFVTWNTKLPAGKYKVTIEGSCQSGTSGLKLDAGTGTMTIEFPSTGSWETYRSVDAGVITLNSGNQTQLALRGVSKKGEGFINLKSITLSKQD